MSGKRDVWRATFGKCPFRTLRNATFADLSKPLKTILKSARKTPVGSPRQPRKIKGKKESRQKTLEGTEGAELVVDAAMLEQLKTLHWRIDAEVLRLYDLPAALERKVLNLFSGVRRRGVPFEQTEYFPKDFTELDRLSDLLAITVDWPKTNRRRAKLIDLEEEDCLTPQQVEELKNLQRLADARISLLHPIQMEGADELIEKLKRRGLWQK